MKFALVMIAVLVTMVLALARAIAGPTVFDRILALNMFGQPSAIVALSVGGAGFQCLRGAR